MSSPTLEERRARTQYLLKSHKCEWCTKQDARTLVGNRLCYECWQKNKARSKEYYLKNKERLLKSSKAWRDMAKESGICMNCGKRKAEEGKNNCAVCNAKKKINNKERYKKMVAEKRCTQCGKSDSRTLSGLTVCQECTDKRKKRGRRKMDKITLDQGC